MEYALVARWLVLYAALFALGLPLAARLLPDARGRGAGLAIPIALVVLSVLAYWVGHLAWGAIALASGVLALLVASALAGLDLGALREREIRLAVDVDRDAVTDAALVFVVGFLLVVAIRSFDPAVYPVGGEKFLDFGLLKTLRRSPVLPPEDFWFANEPVKYYYGGHLTATLLGWLAATPPKFAYNLALAGFYAALLSAAFELAGAVGADRLPSLSGLSPRRARRLAGACAVLFVGVASNLATAGRFALLALPEPLRRSAAELVAAQSQYTVDRILAGADSFSYWSASRIIPGTINEFPLFAWLNGDLHAHMIGTPTLLLAAAVGYAYYRTPESALRRRRALLFAVLPPIAAWQAVQNTWSFPSVLALGWLAAVFAPAAPATLLPAALAGRLDTDADVAADASTPARLRAEVRRVGAATLAAAVAALVAAVLASPFLLGAATGAGGRSIEFLGPAMRSGFGGLLIVHGAFVVGFAAYLLARVRVERAWALVLAVGWAAYIGHRIGFAALALSVPILVLAWVGLRASRSLGYEAVLVVAGAGLVTLVELVYVKEQAGPGRMNTVFKTYMQVWVFWGTAMGVALPGLVLGAFDRGESAGGDADPDPDSRLRHAADLPWRRAGAVGLAVLLVLSTSVYGVIAVGAHFQSAPAGGATLDATQFVETQHPGYDRAIAWIDDLEGQPTIVEAPGTGYYPGGTDGRERVMYSWHANPASSLTGVPTVAGWQHEVGYRGRAAYRERVRDVDAIYTGNATVRAELLRKYEVEYVWVGPSERARYGSVSFSGAAFEAVHRSGDVTIYAVDRDALSEP
ncbi:DUF2298 domain-containing protein [Halobellus rubicundus]|uniref:DUF2298 domain-containing protein n=1 Tax=Halobellus rubicundus TaxID=2996466 RepID=A0ABD5MAX6_9EURY